SLTLSALLSFFLLLSKPLLLSTLFQGPESLGFLPLLLQNFFQGRSIIVRCTNELHGPLTNLLHCVVFAANVQILDQRESCWLILLHDSDLFHEGQHSSSVHFTISAFFCVVVIHIVFFFFATTNTGSVLVFRFRPIAHV